ncbi:MAG: hypothetical protein IM571_00030 [Chitinophagaceae bacterium]|nr:hypothetical protein [Chitinophagaceae bacterium]MCA6511225.1 hypothetical protein [Chitinophagaceae bacterium]
MKSSFCLVTCLYFHSTAPMSMETIQVSQLSFNFFINAIVSSVTFTESIHVFGA